MGTCSTILEGVIFRDWISLSPKRSIGWDIFIICSIISYLHPFPVSELQLLPCNSDIYVDFPFLSCIVVSRGWELSPPHFLSLILLYLCNIIYHVAVSHINYVVIALGFLHIVVSFIFSCTCFLRLVLPSLSDSFLKDLYVLCSYEIMWWLFGYSGILCVKGSLLLH